MVWQGGEHSGLGGIILGGAQWFRDGDIMGGSRVV